MDTIAKLLAIAGIIMWGGCLSDAQIRDSMTTTADCSLHTTVSCTIQAFVDCRTPKEKTGPGWKGYALCLFDSAKHCQLMGLGRCAAAGVIAATGAPFGGGGTFSTVSMMSTGPLPCDLEVAKGCVEDVTIETQGEAVDAVSECYRRICSVGSSAP